MPLFSIADYAPFIISPEFNPKRKEWVKVYEEMSVHLNGRYPVELIDTRRPKEDDERKKYRCDIYQPVTTGVISEALDSLFRIFNDQNYEIKVSSELEVILKDSRFNRLKFMSWIQSHVVKQMIVDPNSAIVVLPSGEGLVDETKAVVPYCELVPSERIIEYGERHISYISLEKSAYTDINNCQCTDGDVYYILNEEGVYRYSKSGEERIDKFTTRDAYRLEEVYKHMQGDAPFTILGGEWNSYKCVYESYFRAFLPFANEALRQFSDFQGVLVTCAYPTRIMMEVECDNTGCTHGYIDGCTDKPCSVCHGTGKIVPSSPYGVFTRKTPANYDDPVDTTPPLEYVSPPVDIVKFSEDSFYKLLKESARALHLEVVNEAQSASAKVVDREREYSMILKISNNIFDNIIYRTLLYMEKYIHPPNIRSYTPPQIVKPQQFQLKTEMALLNELNALKNSNASPNLIRTVLQDIIRRKYAGDDITYKSQVFLSKYDSLYIYSPEEKLRFLELAVIDKEEVFKSTYAPSLLDRLQNSGTINILKDSDEKLTTEMDKEMNKIFNPSVQPAQTNLVS